MKRTLLLALVALGFISLTRPAAAQGKFEGTITMTITMPQMEEEKHDMVLNFKGDQMETEMDLGAQGGIKMWCDQSTKKLYMFVAALGNKGMVMDLPSDTAMSVKQQETDLEIKPTGQKATIAGHAAEEYVVKMKEGESSIWMASDFPKEIREAFHNASAMNQQQQDAKYARAMKQLANKGLVPVKTIFKKDGEVAATMELVKVEPKKMDDKIFERPINMQFSPMPAGMMRGSVN